MTLLIYDFEFNLLLAERRVISARMDEYYRKTGTFEVHLPSDSKVLELVLKNKFLVARLGGFSAVIIGYSLSDELVVYGRTPGWLFEKRVVGTFEKTGSPSEICRNLVSESCGDSVTLGAQVSADSTTEKNERIATLSDCVSDVLKKQNLGWRLDFNTAKKQWIFDIYSGGSDVICLGEGYKNAYDTEASADILDYAACGAYMQNGTVLRVGEPGDLTCFETALGADNAEDAQKELDNCCEKSEFGMYLRGDSVPGLGSSVSLKLVRGDNRVTLKKRVAGIQTSLSDGVKTVKPIFEDE